MGCLGVIKETIILWLQNHINKYLNEINFLQTFSFEKISHSDFVSLWFNYSTYLLTLALTFNDTDNFTLV